MSPTTNNRDDDPLNSRRARVAATGAAEVKFASRVLSEERLKALKEFLKHARSEEIVAVRRLYGDNPEVLKAIGLEDADVGNTSTASDQ